MGKYDKESIIEVFDDLQHNPEDYWIVLYLRLTAASWVKELDST
jgi:hypothetical protein